MNPTPQQQAVIEADPGRHLVVRAFAGAAKTTTLEWRARRHSDRRILYLAFNKSVEQEAQVRFPSNTTAKTTHSLAFGRTGRHFQHKLGNPKPWEALKAFGQRPARKRGPLYASLCLAVVRRFMGSAAESLSRMHLIENEVDALGFDPRQVVEDSAHLWETMKDPDAALPMPHDGYLKIYQMTRPCLSNRFDHILLDEAQDTNEAVFALLRQQQIPLALVGDSYQAIYQFRHSVDVMDRLESADSYSLTGSFRFGASVAEGANALLATFLSPAAFLEGLGPSTRLLIPGEGVPGSNDGAPCYLHRTNAGVFESAVAGHESGEHIHWVGGIERYGLDLLVDVFELSRQNHRAIRSPLIKRFGCVDELRQYAAQVGDPEIMAKIRIQDRLGNATRGLVEALKRRAVSADRADRIVTTAHRSKGSEYPTVVLGSDFAPLMLKVRNPDTESVEDVPRTLGWVDSKQRVIPNDSELYLIYVAMTRAQRNLVVNDHLKRLFEYTGVLPEWSSPSRAA
ncbi:UvrD-helicase domain-containing protein [Thioalkalivibrio sp. ALE16]|uniref:UvrD-helicase domain-containing protein n=1 Tax=Thioalkalivibrio sp. ALE16 TaxID=1158172 RepID=UPI0003759161|nr:UvrD-helicase domain-containing protein [Thioalkalivibrio sp. ALE16]